MQQALRWLQGHITDAIKSRNDINIDLFWPIYWELFLSVPVIKLRSFQNNLIIFFYNRNKQKNISIST